MLLGAGVSPRLYDLHDLVDHDAGWERCDRHILRYHSTRFLGWIRTTRDPARQIITPQTCDLDDLDRRLLDV